MNEILNKEPFGNTWGTGSLDLPILDIHLIDFTKCATVQILWAAERRRIQLKYLCVTIFYM